MLHQRLLLGFAAAIACTPAHANLLQEQAQRFHPVESSGGMVSAQEAQAAAVGAQILRQGGNAVDAAVATSFALAVTLPQAGNLGGGGFLVLWLPRRGRISTCSAVAREASPPQALAVGRGEAVALNFRETAPQGAGPDLFLNPDGSVNRERALRSLLSTGVPGTVAGLTRVQARYGCLPLAAVMQPAIDLAEQGFPVGAELSASLAAAAPLLKAHPASARQFFKPGGQPYQPGERLRQPELAASLRCIAQQGASCFYRGRLARQLTALMQSRGGLISRADLAAYQAPWVTPLQASFQGHRVVTMPPPSGGGATLLQLLKVLEPLNLAATGLNSAATIHVMVEAMNLAYRDRNRLLGDPDQVAMPLDRLLSDPYATEQRQRIRADRHRPAAELEAEPSPLVGEGTNTTHLSVVDRDGGLVATTTTLNTAYGNGITVPGAGFLLNNEMDDFTAKPGAPNAYGLRQGSQNAIAPGRRPLSSMTPTLVYRPDDSPLLATGSPGGSRIITTVLQVLLNRLVHGLNLASAVAAPRIHSQLWPDQISVEQGFSPDTLRLLQDRGHQWRLVPAMGSANSVEVRYGTGGSVDQMQGSHGVADPRRLDAAAVAERP
ncbi:gamma-glutamyltransferase [Synechococcus sp. HK05]|nr:gamma-glutamyltransferase [Synechococcus sp. HK05]